jgi:hypothetical protein
MNAQMRFALAVDLELILFFIILFYNLIIMYNILKFYFLKHKNF